ncbi:hypothetical protein [Roseisolibacter sp. H3M3-2]|uniref:hypothetical protein n=1 Tax=Roseisolibacter sp. H3M3-2 TaxID=3031323 RepID=UPI0023D97AB6|nr:hypothetical protein [Roseisolibacter sp. H3M3-2]MDF1505000.1 hypothetical protein [Roseisolibacter sp. H3M3-2]
MNVRTTPLAAAAALALAACATDPASPVAGSTLKPTGRLALAMNEAGSVVVTEDDIARQAENTPPTNNWVLYTRAAGNATFRSGPATPPAGVGSLEFVTPTGADKVYLFNYDHVQATLASITGMGYSTYRAAGEAQQVAALNLQVDVNGAAAGGFTTLVFEPVYNTLQGAVVSGQWQSWDAYSGGNAIWWSSNPIPGAPNRDTFVSWNTIKQNNPDAVIVGGVGVNQGSGNNALTTAVDNFTLARSGETVTYNFEPYRVAANVESCKNGGWMSLKDSEGDSFKNQGDCVSYVASKR